MQHGRDMHIMSAVNLRIDGNHVRRSADRLARTAGIPAVKGVPEPTIGPAQLWKGYPFVATLNLPGQPQQTSPLSHFGFCPPFALVRNIWPLWIFPHV